MENTGNNRPPVAAVKSQGTERSLKDQVLDALDAGVDVERIMNHFNLSLGEFEDITGEVVDEDEANGRSEVTGY